MIPFCCMKKNVSLFEIAKLFLTIGTIGFGEGMAIIALMQDYCVNRKKWLSNEEFAHGIALGQFLGPFSVNAAIFVGYRLRGYKGGIVSVICFLLPSSILVILLSALYYKYHSLPSLQSALKGVGPVVIALILAAGFRIGKGSFKSIESVVILSLTILFALVFKMQVFNILILALLYGVLKEKLFNKEGKNEV